jgi:hypothetical protein
MPAHRKRGFVLAKPTTVLWDANEHTLAKHEILRRYLQAWLPIIYTAKLQPISWGQFLRRRNRTFGSG